MSQIDHTSYHDLHLLLITGVWREGSASQSLQVSDPYNGKTLLQIKQATHDDLDEAYQVAQRVQVEWAMIGSGQRPTTLYRVVQIPDERREEIIGWITREPDNIHVKAQIEWGIARNITLKSTSSPARVRERILSSSAPGKENRIHREPLGVVGVISPWNSPLHLTRHSVTPALALGNAVVIRPASDTPMMGGLLAARIFEGAGVPVGVIGVLADSGAEIGDAFVEHPMPKFVSFINSTPVGANIGRIASGGKHLKYVALELGGNSPFAVLADADLEQAVTAAVMGKLLHQGQICMAINRIIVGDTLCGRFVKRYAERVKTLKVDDSNESDIAVGPIINHRQLDMLLSKVARTREKGARSVVEGDICGQLLPPHTFADVTTEMKIIREKIFGPLVGIQRVRNETHAPALADDSELGLPSAVSTADLERDARFTRRIKADMIHVNDIPVSDETYAPSGGEGNSGLGRFSGEWAIGEFTIDHRIGVRMTLRKYPFQHIDTGPFRLALGPASPPTP